MAEIAAEPIGGRLQAIVSRAEPNGMTHLTTPSLVRQIGSLFDGDSVAGLSDRQLIDRFVARRDSAAEAAFAALVARHGPMVLGVCRQLLGDRHHAEDAFQAVFLVLARKAGSIRDSDLLGNWLYGVAIRTARKGKARLGRQRRQEEGDAMIGPGVASIEPMAPPADQPAIDREQAQALHDEIDRLPGAFRMPVVLCYFEGLTLDEAARRLRCPEGTVRSRLARAREKLRRGLTRRGVVLPAAALVAVLDARIASASVSSPLRDITTRAALNFAAGHAAAPAATALAREVLRSMLIHKLRFLAATLLFLGVVATGAGYLARALAIDDAPGSSPAGPQAPVAAKPDDADPKPAPGRMFVVGRVLDPSGKPVPGASIMVHAQDMAIGRPPYLSQRHSIPIGDARADGSGRFRLDAPRTSSSRHDAFGAVALAPGYGAGWVELDPDDDQPAADITLRPEQVIRGRLFDVQGRPAPDVTLSVAVIHRTLPKDSARARTSTDRVVFLGTTIKDYPAWPRPVMTDADGRFTVRGVGRDSHGGLDVHHPRFAFQRVAFDTDVASASKPLTAALAPAQILNVRVTYADTGEPVPHAPLQVMASRGRVGLPAEFETDAEGRCRVNSDPTDRSYNVWAYPPEGQPYLTAHERIEWPKAALEQSVDLALPRGIAIHGKVTEAGSGKPIAGATVDFYSREQMRATRASVSIVSSTASDGSFRLGAGPHPGCLFVKCPGDDYMLVAIGNRMVNEGQPGGRRIYAHAYSLLDLKPGIGSQEVNLVLRHGATVTGRVVGPDGEPVREAWSFSRIILDPRQGAWTGWAGRHHGQVRKGHFEIHGLGPETEVPVYFLEPKAKLGVVVNLSVKSSADGPVIVRLQPCGAARARLVDPAGKPVAGRLRRGFLVFSMVVTPGPPRGTTNDTAGLLTADEDDLTVIDPVNYERELTADADGRISLPVLIPGATYVFIDYTTPRGTDPPVRKEFTVKPGETLDLGDIRIERPIPQ
jgi:RNA polymerase sigma factor (sigma-70 family)